MKYGSDFGDIVKKEYNEPMKRCISSNTVPEGEDADLFTLDPSEPGSSGGFAQVQVGVGLSDRDRTFQSALQY